MLDSLKQAGKTIGRELNRTWESLSDGWRELLSRNGNSLTQFSRSDDDKDSDTAKMPRWSLLAGELEETDTDVVARIELPGMEREDCRVRIDGNTLTVSGEKRYERETADSSYHLMERAYGSFERSFLLPRNVDAEQTVATYKNGVLTVRLPKLVTDTGKNIPVA
jgi:HSP20 family protein